LLLYKAMQLQLGTVTRWGAKTKTLKEQPRVEEGMKTLPLP